MSIITRYVWQRNKITKNITAEIRAKIMYTGLGGSNPRAINDKNDITNKAKLTLDLTPLYLIDLTGERSSQGKRQKK